MATFTFTAGLNEFIGGSANDLFIVVADLANRFPYEVHGRAATLLLDPDIVGGSTIN